MQESILDWEETYRLPFWDEHLDYRMIGWIQQMRGSIKANAI